MRPLAVAARNRTPYFPDVPTIAEAGYPLHEVGFWMGVFVPVGTPKALVVGRILDLKHQKLLIQSMFMAAHSRAATAWRSRWARSK